MIRGAITTLACLLLPLAGLAHSASTAYLQLTVSNRVVAIQLELSLRDLDDHLGLDVNDDGRLTWGELRQRQDDVIRLVRRGLTLGSDSESWPLAFQRLEVNQRGGEGFAVVSFSAVPPGAEALSSLSYRLFFDEDPLHRCLAAVTAPAETPSGLPVLTASVLSPERSVLPVDLGGPTSSSPRALGTFVREGTHHIWTGYDHLLFLLALLLPAVLRRTERGWEPTSSLRSATVDVLKVVTAFTVAHSLTLALAAFEIIRLPSRLVESMIAASIVVAALANLWPRRRDRNLGDGHAASLGCAPDFESAGLSEHHFAASARARRALGPMEDWDPGQGKCSARAMTGWQRPAPWKIAFFFGLIHGFGFAGVLGELGLQRSQLAAPLFGFNLGVELGQLVCVAFFLPLAFWLRSTRFYQRGALPFGSLLIIVLAGGWLVERAFDLGFMPI